MSHFIISSLSVDPRTPETSRYCPTFSLTQRTVTRWKGPPRSKHSQSNINGHNRFKLASASGRSSDSRMPTSSVVRGLNVAGAEITPTPERICKEKSSTWENKHVDKDKGSSASSWTSLPDKELHQSFIRNAVDIILDKAVFSGTQRENKVLEWRDPQQLKSFLDLRVRKESTNHEDLLELITRVIQSSVKTGHPYFINQLFSSVDPYGLVGQWLTDALNPSVYTYEVAPAFTLMEEEVLREMRRAVGWPNPEQGDGIFCPGGSIANGYGLSCARHHLVPEAKSLGLTFGKRLVVFTSAHAHYSTKKMAAWQGIGSNNVYLIRTDSRGRMDVDHLSSEIARAREEGAQPLAVVATAGTTVLGAFDPIRSIAQLLQNDGTGIWLHVDAAWGGGALLSKKHRHLLDGIELADSVTWNPHKLLAAPQQCSTFLTRHGNILSSTHSAHAEYLFQRDKFYDTSFDTGDKHIQCGRRADVAKFWLMWKAKGTDGLEAHIDRVFNNSQNFTKKIRSQTGFKLVLSEPECTNVCFWYIPPSLRHLDTESDEFRKNIHKIAPQIKEQMMRQGTMMVTYQPLDDLPNFFRLVLQNSALTHEDMDYFINEFHRLGVEL